ncbi:MAG: stage III sporulation protein AF [Hydrogenibacillus schlegelii]|nr:stage III sporulation protein AF [Hydrogenibacillus schlegelii]
MRFLSDWIRELIFVVLMATVVDLVLPSGEMRRYVRFVLGLFVLVTLVGPVFSLFGVRELDERAIWERMARAGSDPFGATARQALERQTVRLAKAGAEARAAVAGELLEREMAAGLSAAVGRPAEVRVHLRGDGPAPEVRTVEVYFRGQGHKTDSKVPADDPAQDAGAVEAIRVELGAFPSAGSAGRRAPEERRELEAEVLRFFRERYGLSAAAIRIVGP